MATLEEKAFASMATRKREQISNNTSPEKFIGDVYCNGFKNGYAEGYADGLAEKVPSDKVIKKILNLAWEYNASDVEVNNLTEEGEFQYVKEHLCNN